MTDQAIASADRSQKFEAHISSILAELAVTFFGVAAFVLERGDLLIQMRSQGLA